MDADEVEVYSYLKTAPGQFISGREVCRRAGGKWRYRQDEKWALPALRRMVEKGLLESDDTGHYRLPRKTCQKKKEKRWISPEIRRILQRSGRDFGVIIVDEDLSPEDLALVQILPTQTVTGSSGDSEPLKPSLPIAPRP